MSVAIVTTSINPRPPSYEKWAKEGDLIVAGDRNTPSELAEYVKEIGGRYLSPEDQEHLSQSLSDATGWACIQRRNFAILQAYADGYRTVITVDDDNTPLGVNWARKHAFHLNGNYNADEVISRTGWVNSGDFVDPSTIQRGTPYSKILPDADYEMGIANGRVVVSQSQVIGDPDISAVTRYLDDPSVDRVNRGIVVRPDREQWAAFNSQATAWNGDWAPFMACLPGIGRYDDIWASLIAESVMGFHEVGVYFGNPAVRQVRNVHNLNKDLRAELFGMENTLAMVELIKYVIPEDAFTRTYLKFVESLSDILPYTTIRFMSEWAIAVGIYANGRTIQ